MLPKDLGQAAPGTGQGAARPADPNPALHRLTLRFADSDLERRFRMACRDSDLRQARLSLLAGAVVNTGFVAIEWTVLTQNLPLAIALRLCATALLVVTIALSHLDVFRRHLDWLATLPVLGFTLIYAALNAVADTPDVYLTGFVLVILFVLYFVPLRFVATSALSLGATLLFSALIPLTRGISPEILAVIYPQFVAALALGMVGLYWLERLQRREFLNLQRIAGERRQYRNLLTRILPTEIVERLEHGEAEIADEFAQSTVLFADIVDFTEATERHAPAEVLALLDRVFRSFDALVERHGVEKIKTIGDAYMAAGGVPHAHPDNCAAIAQLALDMMQTVAGIRWPDGAPVRLRIGIDAGPLIAGVIGQSRFIYDLWGDTVNTASRMESGGSPGRIQVSDRVRERLQPRFAFEPHGEVEIKGKGTMKTWFLTGRVGAAASTQP